MSTYEYRESYVPIEPSTPTKTPQGTPISTPSRAALLRPNFMTRGSPIKFTLSTPEKAMLKDVEFDWEAEQPRKSGRISIMRTIFLVLLWSVFLLLIAAAIYFSVVYIKSAALGVTRWANNIKNAFRFGLVVTTLSAGFALGYVIMRYLEFPRTPWNGNMDQPRQFTVNWLMFLFFLVGVPVASTLVPFILGHSGQFNSDYQAWNNACMDDKYTSMFHIRYISTIGSTYSMTVYARDVNGTYHYLGLLPTSDPNNNNVILTTPNFVLYPTTNPIVPDTAAGRQIFSVATNETDPRSSQIIASLELDTSDDNHTIIGKCITSTEQPANLTTCVDGFLRAYQISNKTLVENPSIRVIGNRTKTLEIMYDVTPVGNTSSNTTFLDGYVDSWPDDQTWFMTGDTAVDNAPSEVMVESDSAGYILASDGVSVVSSPWPACDGLKVCATSGVAGMIASGWIWENLDQWMWYSTEQCMS